MSADAGAPRQHRSPRRLLFLVGAAFLVALVAIVPLRCLSSDAGASIKLGDTSAEATDSELRISTEVRSPDGQTQRFRLWYTLTVDGAERPTFQSATTFGTVEGTEPTEVQLTDPINVAPGNYQLDLWVHERGRDDFAHATSQRVLVDLDDARPSLLRTTAPTEVAVEQAAVTLTPQNPVPTAGQVVVQNLTEEAREVTIAVGLADATVTPELGGDAPPTTWTEPTQLVVEPLSSAQVELDQLVPLQAGRYRTRVEVREGDQLYDDAIVPDTVDIGDSSPAVARDELPSGDLMITDAAVPVEWIDTQRQEISVSVLNLSDEPHTGRVYLSLAPARVDEPWGRSRAYCAPVDLEVPARETVTASISCAVASPVEELLVSIWVHEVTEDATVHSDGVVAASPTIVVPEPSIEHRADRAIGSALVVAIAGPEEVAVGDELVATATIENLTGDVLDVEVWWILYDLTADTTDEPASEGDRTELRLEPGERIEVQIGGPAPDVAGTYQLSVAVHARDADGELVHGDQAWAIVPVRVVG